MFVRYAREVLRSSTQHQLICGEMTTE